MFGKLMSIPDELMSKYYTLVLGEVMDANQHPMEAKKHLAARCVETYHNAEAAQQCRADWDIRFSKRDLDNADLPSLTLGEKRDVLSVVAHAFETCFQMKPSNGDIRRLIQGGSIQLGGEKLADPKSEPVWEEGQVLKLDKKRSVRITAV